MLYNFFLEKLILPLGDILVGSRFIQNLKLLRKQDNLTQKELEQLQKEKLKKLLNYAIKKSPYYKSFAHLKEEDPIEFLKKMPILTKTIVREKYNDILTTNKPLIMQRSSGSSGFQTTVYFNKKEQSLQRAYQIRWWEWAGFKIGQPVLQTGITPNRGFIKKIKDMLFKTYYIPAFSHSKEQIDKAFKWAKKRKNPFLAGYSSSLYTLSKADNSVSFKSAICWGDKLFLSYRKDIEKKFNLKVYETYASSEGFMIAGQKDLEYMYIMSTDVFIEILDKDGNDVKDGEIGEVIVTKLNNFSMPLIRYKIGDLASLLPKEDYPKNREFEYPLLKEVIGRDTDLIKTPLGKTMVVHSFTGIIEHHPTIKQYSVVQKEIYGITIEYIPQNKKEFDKEILNKIEKEIQKYLQEESFYITFKEVEKIEPTASGKPQIIRSYLKD